MRPRQILPIVPALRRALRFIHLRRRLRALLVVVVLVLARARLLPMVVRVALGRAAPHQVGRAHRFLLFSPALHFTRDVLLSLAHAAALSLRDRCVDSANATAGLMSDTDPRWSCLVTCCKRTQQRR